MFLKKYELRYGDLGENKNVKISTVLELLQDISIAHSGAAGFSLNKLYAQSNAFLLQGWRVKFIEPLSSRSDIEVKTGIMKIRKVEAIRKYEIRQDGQLKIIATAVWFMVDTDKMKIVNIPDNLQDAYESVNEPDNGLSFVKLKPAKDLSLLGDTKVERRDIDTNGHMNNVKSVDAALEFISDKMEIAELQVTYRRELFRGSTVQIYGKTSENDYYAELKNESGETCVLVHALGK